MELLETLQPSAAKRKRKTVDPCEGCRLHRTLCICDQIPSLNLRTRVCLVIHRRELKRTTNTGRLAIKSLVNSEMRIRGDLSGKPLDLADLKNSRYRSLLFFPSDDALELTTDLLAQSNLPIQLIVPDGNWRQASKLLVRHPELEGMERVKLSASASSVAHLRSEYLRAETRPEGISTLEAIALALGVIEGESAMRPLLNLYQAKLQNTLRGRGQLAPKSSF